MFAHSYSTMLSRTCYGAWKNAIRPAKQASSGHDSYAWLFLLTLTNRRGSLPLQLLQCGRLLHTPMFSSELV